MELAFAQMPMVLFTTLAPMASGAFIGLAIAFLTVRFSEEKLARIDRWTALPLAILAVGLVASFVFYASPQYAVIAFQGIGIASVAWQFIASMLFASLAVVYWIIALTGNLPYRARVVFSCVVGVASLLYSLVIGAMYMGSAVATWSSPLVPLGLMGFAAAGGVPLGVLVVVAAKALPEARETRFGGVSLIAAFIGVVVAIFAVAAQLLYAQSAFSAYFSGAELLSGSWVYLLVSIIGFVVMLGCLRGAVLPGGRSASPLGRTAGAAAAIPQRDIAEGEHARVSPLAYMVIGNVAVIAAIMVARMMFYALQL